jgi:hypothetical protein
MPCHGHALGVVAAESGMQAEDRLEPVDECLPRESGADPVIGVRHGAEVDGQEGADRSNAEKD